MTAKFPDSSLLLHPQIPKPLHLHNPRTILGEDWWIEQRQLAYEKHNYQCYACGVHKLQAEYYQRLDAHETYSIDYTTGKLEFIGVVALCYACHNFIHYGRMQMLVAKGEFEESEYKAIMARGRAILKLSGVRDNRKRKLDKLAVLGKVCGWRDWHLVIDGVNYGQRFHSHSEWQQYWIMNSKMVKGGEDGF